MAEFRCKNESIKTATWPLYWTTDWVGSWCASRMFGRSISDHSVTSMEFVETGSEIMTIIRILSNSEGNNVLPSLCVSCFAFLRKIP